MKTQCRPPARAGCSSAGYCAARRKRFVLFAFAAGGMSARPNSTDDRVDVLEAVSSLSEQVGERLLSVTLSRPADATCWRDSSDAR